MFDSFCLHATVLSVAVDSRRSRSSSLHSTLNCDTSPETGIAPGFSHHISESGRLADFSGVISQNPISGQYPYCRQFARYVDWVGPDLLITTVFPACQRILQATHAPPTAPTIGAYE